MGQEAVSDGLRIDEKEQWRQEMTIDKMMKEVDRRWLAKLKYEKFYEEYITQENDGDSCFYCGDPRECTDHCPPLIWVLRLTKDWFDDQDIHLWIVPSCMECNQWLGTIKLFTPVERKQRVKQKLIINYGKYLSSTWEGEEIEELGWMLKTMVGHQYDVSKWIERRLRY